MGDTSPTLIFKTDIIILSNHTKTMCSWITLLKLFSRIAVPHIEIIHLIGFCYQYYHNTNSLFELWCEALSTRQNLLSLYLSLHFLHFCQAICAVFMCKICCCRVNSCQVVKQVIFHQILWSKQHIKPRLLVVVLQSPLWHTVSLALTRRHQ